MLEILRTQKFEEIINGKKVKIAIKFTSYTPKVFDFDVDLIKLINTRGPGAVPEQMKGRAKQVRRYEIFFRKGINKKISQGLSPTPDYTRFRKVTSRILFQCISDIMKNTHAALLDKEETLEINLNVVSRYLEGNLACHLYEESRPGRIELQLSGSALAGRIYYPWLFKSKIDVSFIRKTLVHELEHHAEHLRGLYIREDEAQAKIREFMKLNPQKWGEGFPLLFEVLCNLYTEGLATFIERKHSASVLLDVKKVAMLKESIERISLAKTHEEAVDVVENEFRQHSEDGEYYLGYLMCYFIGLSFLKKRGVTSVKAMPNSNVEFAALESFLLARPKVRLMQLDEATFKETYAALSKIRHYTEFLKMFTMACKELNLGKSMVFMDTEFHAQLMCNVTMQKSVAEVLLPAIVSSPEEKEAVN